MTLNQLFHFISPTFFYLLNLINKKWVQLPERKKYFLVNFTTFSLFTIYTLV